MAPDARPHLLAPHRLAVVLLLLLGAGLLGSAIGVIESSRDLERSNGLLRDLDRLQALARHVGDAGPEGAAKGAGALQSGLQVLQTHPARDLLDAEALASLQGGAERLARGMTVATAGVDALLAAQLANVQAAADEMRRSGERQSHWLLVLASLMLGLSLAVVAITRVRLRREAVERARAEADTAASHEELNASVEKLTDVSLSMQRLSAYASLLQSCQAIEEALDITKISLSVLMPGYAGSVYLLREVEPEDEGVERAELAISWGEHPMPSRDGFLADDCWGMRRARPFSTDPRTADLHCAHLQAGELPPDTATLCLPLSAQGEAIGLMYLSGPDPLRGDDRAVTAAEQLSMALANLKMKERLHNQSIRDALTGLFNRRYLEEVLLREQSRSNRRQRPLAVMMLDVDHFKRFNDTHGHPGGDALLTALGRLLRQTSRAEDIPCRYGGEEFTVIMPDTDATAAQAQAERIRAAVAAMSLRHEGKPLSAVTASIGLAIYPQTASGADALIEAADAALYRAKTEGRDRVRLAEPREVAAG